MPISKALYAAVLILALAFPPILNAHTFKIVHSFQCCNDGGGPFGSLLYQGGRLYGTTYEGGAESAGVIFMFNPATAAEKVVASLTRHSEGSYAEGGLAYLNGDLFGTTDEGGAEKVGAVFKASARSGHIIRVAAFQRSAGNVQPATLTAVGSRLYGTTMADGVNRSGTLYSVDPAARTIDTLFQFGTVGDNLYPGGVLTYLNGSLYGVLDNGSVFAFNIATAVESSVATLGSAVGYPVLGVVYQNGLFYGTARIGTETGTIYSVNPSSGDVSVLCSFKGGGDAGTPSSLLTYNAGVLYGTTLNGGAAHKGTVFAFDLTTGSERVLYSFGGHADGENPASNMVWTAGALYGTIRGGGKYGEGILFKITP